MSPAGRAAVVTGAAGAIGVAIADRLEADGLRVARSDLGPAAEYPCDVRREDDVIGLREAVQERLGAPWLLVNVAGVFFEHDVPDTTEEQFDLIVDTNLKGTFLTCKAFLPAMLAAGDGCIVNIASTAGIRGGHRRAVYNASKGGVVLLTRSLALDHAPAGVRINCVCPGLIDTPMADWIRLDPSELAAFEGWAPARRMGTPQEIAGAVSFLASEDAAYMHGAVMVVDGGTTA
jgi:NAD(P)-dependent dehydrogenase (short-subunit alcohol dehydrogenase family)